METLTREEIIERAGHSLDHALESVPAIRLTEEEAVEIGFGGRLLLDTGERAVDTALIGRGSRSIVIRNPHGTALAMGELLAEGDAYVRVAPNLVFPWAVRHGRTRDFE
jgi:hypothetical protein